jgi:hypothetical protein
VAIGSTGLQSDSAKAKSSIRIDIVTGSSPVQRLSHLQPLVCVGVLVFLKVPSGARVCVFHGFDFGRGCGFFS